MFKNLTIKSRLIFVIGFLALQLIIGAVIGIVSLGFANNSIKAIYDDRLVSMEKLEHIARLLSADQLLIAKSITTDSATATKFIEEITQNRQDGAALWVDYMALDKTSEEQAMAAQFAQDNDKFVTEGINAALTSLHGQDTSATTALLNGTLNTLFLPAKNSINQLIQLQLTVAKQEYQQSQNTYQLVRASCTAGVLFGVILAIFIGIWLVRAISRPLDAAIHIATGIAAGDLTQHIDISSGDETGRLLQALKTMNDSLLHIVARVRTGTDTIATASSEIAAGNLDLSSRTEAQANSLQQTSTSMEEQTTTVRQNAENARQANALASSASEMAKKGGAVVEQVVETMASINDSSKRIVDIISVIDGIAFQTNILALNAAVEAARAGEQGRGFAVVASEVRNLAQRSAAAAKEIKTLISDTVDKVTAGTTLVDQAGRTINDVVESVRRVTDIMGDITEASASQSVGITQVNQAIAQMDAVTQQNAALVEEAAATAESLQDQVRALAQVVGIFRLGDRVTNKPTTPAKSTKSAPPRLAPSNRSALASRPAVIAPTRPTTPSKALTSASSGDDWEEF